MLRNALIPSAPAGSGEILKTKTIYCAHFGFRSNPRDNFLLGLQHAKVVTVNLSSAFFATAPFFANSPRRVLTILPLFPSLACSSSLDSDSLPKQA